MYYNKSNIDCILKYMNSTNIWIQHINGSPGRHVSFHTKVVQPAVLFSNSKHLFVRHFLLAAGQPTQYVSMSCNQL